MEIQLNKFLKIGSLFALLLQAAYADDRKDYSGTHIAAPYPGFAASLGIFGYCTVEFEVSREGYVKNQKAVDCQPPGYFESVSLTTIGKYRYKPRIVNGEAVTVAGVRQTFRFPNDTKTVNDVKDNNLWTQSANGQ